jgi:RecB family exonuclease
VRAQAPDEPTLDTRPHAIGTLLHEVFERFVLLLREHAGQPETLADPVAREAIKLSDHGGRATGLKLMAEAFEYAVSVTPAEGPFWDGVKKLVASGLPGHADDGLGSGLLARFIDAELERNEQGHGIRFVEFTFAKPRKDSPTGPDTLPYPLELTVEGGTIWITGSVDRVDEGPAGLEILDYKTGKAKSTKEVRDGRAFQLPAYLAAISKVTGSAPSGMGYLQVPPDGPIQHVDVTQAYGKPAYDVNQLVFEQLPERLTRILTALRNGTFVHLPWSRGTPCKYCDYATACAKRDDIIAQRQQMMPEMESVYLPDSE